MSINQSTCVESLMNLYVGSSQYHGALISNSAILNSVFYNYIKHRKFNTMNRHGAFLKVPLISQHFVLTVAQ